MNCFKTLLFLLFSIGLPCYSQVRGTVVDKSTEKSVPYANIWVEKEGIGTSANADGNFTIETKDLRGKSLIVTSVAYQKQHILINDDVLKIELVPVVYVLDEAVVNAEGKKKIIDFKKRNASFGGAGTPWIVGRFYPYSEEYAETPFITELSFGTYSRGNPLMYRVRFLSVDQDGKPGNDLIPHAIYLTTKQGHHIIQLDLQKYNIRIPTSGFVVGVEFIQGYKKYGQQHLGVDAKIVEYDDGRNWDYWNGAWSNKAYPGIDNKGVFEIQFKLKLSE